MFIRLKPIISIPGAECAIHPLQPTGRKRESPRKTGGAAIGGGASPSAALGFCLWFSNSCGLTRDRGLGGKVTVSVSDNGPGFVGAAGGNSLPESCSAEGYGLRNIQDRLRAHYGASALLRFRRDDAAAVTVVSFEIPAVAEAAGTG
jgi:hypothetical protein